MSAERPEHGAGGPVIASAGPASAGADQASAGGPAGGAGPSGPSGPADSGGERQVPFFCPYCGEEELRPAGSKPGDWECRSCSRGFQLRFAGLLTARTEPLS